MNILKQPGSARAEMKVFFKILNPVLIALIIVGGVYIYFLLTDSTEKIPYFGREREEDMIQRNVMQNALDTAVISTQNNIQAADPYAPRYPDTPLPRQAAAPRNDMPMPQDLPAPDNDLQGIESYRRGLAGRSYRFQNPQGFQQAGLQRQDTFKQKNTLIRRNAFTEKILQEGHWIGLEVIPLTSIIAAANNIPANISGVIIDEVTLLAAESGLLAADVITGIDGYSVHDLTSFRLATREAANSMRGIVSIYRAGSYRDIAVTGMEALGVAQMEAAPMIRATDKSPHSYYGPCDRCHSITRSASNSGHLAKDMGDVLIRRLPPIQAGIQSIHEDRGRCASCHDII